MAAEEAPAKAAKGTVKLFGQSLSKRTLLIGGLVGAGVLGYAYYRRSKNGGAAAAAGTSSAAGDTDPETGYPYGSAEDTSALAAQDSGLDTNLSGSVDPATGIPYADEIAAGGGAVGSTGTTTTAAVTTNAEWEQECIANLEAGGVAQSTISSAESGLPRYLAKLSLSPAQATAVQMAVGLTGPPPVGGPYNIIAAPAAPVPPRPQVTIPHTAGDRVERAESALHTLGLKTSVPSRKPGTAYWVTAMSPGAGTKVAAGSTVHLSISAKQPRP